MSKFICIGSLLILTSIKIIIISGSDDSRVEVITVEKPKYVPTWESLDSRPLPAWYDEAKIGIFIHWGVYSVPTMGTEWFWTNWRNEHVPSYVNYMAKNFKPGFTYQEFAKDFTAEHFNPNEWAKIFQESGAKYVVLTSKHHDGFALWPSKYSYSWNSVDVGPHRDIVGELANAIRTKTSLKFGLYHSLFEWFNPMYLSDKEKSFEDNLFVVNKVWPEMKELVKKYKPEVFWSDGDWEPTWEYWNTTDFFAWLYNDSPVSDTIVTNDRWGRGTLCEHGDFLTCSDRYNPGVLQKKKWENAMSIDKYSWGHRATARLDDFLTAEQLIQEVAITISTGGNILIDVGPTSSGLIQPIFVERLRALGYWLRINGEAIYESHAWIHQNDTKTPYIWYTSKSNKNPDGINRVTVYAIVLRYPFDSDGVNLYSLGDKFDNNSTVHILGYPETLKWYGSDESMFITFPNKAILDKLGLMYAWTLKIDLPAKKNN